MLIVSGNELEKRMPVAVDGTRTKPVRPDGATGNRVLRNPWPVCQSAADNRPHLQSKTTTNTKYAPTNLDGRTELSRELIEAIMTNQNSQSNVRLAANPHSPFSSASSSFFGLESRTRMSESPDSVLQRSAYHAPT